MANDSSIVLACLLEGVTTNSNIISTMLKCDARNFIIMKGT